MASINDIAIRTPIASVASGSHLRVYELANDGGVREAVYEGKWTGGGPGNVVGVVKPSSPLAACALPGLTNIRVYGLDENNRLKEICWDTGKGWFVGGLTNQFTVAAYSSVAAVWLANKHILRVYAQLADNTIQEFSWDESDGKGWRRDQNLGPALPGTSIAAISWGAQVSEIGIRVYFQDPTLTVIEKCHDPTTTWYNGALKFALHIPRASLAAVAWGGVNQHIRVYYGTVGDRIREKAKDVGGGWSDGGFDQPSIPASRVAALSIGGSSDLRVYLQNGTVVTAVSEYGWVVGSWVLTYKGLPPA